ncbi:MAG: bifunctional methylenetetrahydrofolate dehydrogenase/methenyltetrahydrofolate cyclohydrolase [Candidatus Izimaplasma sp.]|nr:bifunctional methylenetetrahydrofolate dehydrogenase/methenyltetrahydrofolate cyclohydrolase [Candidatus Izimaplasma bacterium]
MGITTVIDGKKLSETIHQELKEDIKNLQKKYNDTPHLVVVLVGDDPASLSYVKYKKRACDYVNIDSTMIRLPKHTKEEELIKTIDKLNKDETINGILVQLPLPEHIDRNIIIDRLQLNKDVDGLQPIHIARLHTLRYAILPCTPKGIITILKRNNIKIEGEHAVVIGRSNLVGKPIAQLLLKENATVTITHRYTKDLATITKHADIVVSAVGKANLITKDMVKEGAVCIDVGLDRVNNKLTGDFDFDNLLDHVSYITKAPGGVGPMTITSLLENTIECFINQKESREL